MEKRKIYINDTASNKVIILETDATTFGEIKTAAVQAGIDINNKDWLEGITKTSPVDDSAILPTNVPYKGSVTNDLVFLLTNTNKKIKNGNMNYKEMKSYIKDNNLAEKFKLVYDKNYTQGKFEEFEEFIKANTKTSESNQKSAEEKLIDLVNNNEINDNDVYKEKYNNIVLAIAEMLYKLNDYVFKDVSNKIEEIKSKEPKPLNLSESDIKNIF